MRTAQAVRVTLTGPGASQSSNYDLAAGDHAVLSFTGNGYSAEYLQQRQAAYNLEDTRLPSYLSELYHQLLLGYWIELENLGGLLARESGVVSYSQPSYGMAVSPLAVDYYFGIPRLASYKSRVLDVKRVAILAVHTGNDQAKARDYVLTRGLVSSAMESGIFEYSRLASPGQSVSAATAIQIANAEGQRILEITADNVGAALAAMTHDAAVEADIQNAVDAGFRVIAHQHPVIREGFVGAGYAILDPVTGSGAYRISGGRDGVSSPGPVSVIPLPQRADIGALSFLLSRVAIHAGGRLVAATGGAAAIILAPVAPEVAVGLLPWIIALLILIAVVWQGVRSSERSDDGGVWYLRHYGVRGKILNAFHERVLIASDEKATFGAGVYFADAKTENILGIECPLTRDDQVSAATRYEIPERGRIRPEFVEAWIELEIPRRMPYKVTPHSNDVTLAAELVLESPIFPYAFPDKFSDPPGMLRGGNTFIYFNSPDVRVVRACLDGGIIYD